MARGRTDKARNDVSLLFHASHPYRECSILMACVAASHLLSSKDERGGVTVDRERINR